MTEVAPAEEPPVIAEEKRFLVDVENSDVLYDHLTKVLLKVIKASPDDALEQFENLSMQVKTEEAAKASEPAPLLTDENKASITNAATTTLHLIKAPKKVVEGEDEEPAEEEEEKEAVPIPDIMSDANLLAWGGVGLSDMETYKMMLSIQKLATANDLQSVRFWGVIHGTKKNYYVVEAKLEDYGEEEIPEGSPREAMGTGANEYIYYVTNSAESAWSKLPAVEPQWVILARDMRRYFTGDLDATVLGFPRFPYKEAAYLRAQIARITHATTVAPKGVFTVDEEAEPEEQVPAENEEYGGLNPYKGDVPTSWTHIRAGLLKQGRVTPVVVEGEEEEEDEEGGEAKKKDEEEKEVAMRPLLTLDQDAGTTWKFNLVPSVHDPTAASVATSLSWPGAVCVAQGKRTLNFYAGWGQKQLTSPYSPPAPTVFQSEYSIEADEKLAGKIAGLDEEADVPCPEGWTPAEKEDVKEEEDEGDDEEPEAAKEEEEEA